MLEEALWLRDLKAAITSEPSRLVLQIDHMVAIMASGPITSHQIPATYQDKAARDIADRCSIKTTVEVEKYHHHLPSRNYVFSITR